MTYSIEDLVVPKCYALPTLVESDMPTYLYGTFAFRRMSFCLFNALGTFQRCMMAKLSDMVEKSIEIFMHDLSVIGSSFDQCLEKMRLVLKRCMETNLVLN